MRVAVPIIASRMDDALRDMDRAFEVADVIELRIDYMIKPNLERLLRHNNVPKIVTNRVKGEGGKFGRSEEERVRYLQEAIDLGVEYVDIELNYFHRLNRESSRLIVSYHNFKETPCDSDLNNIYSTISRKHPDIIKIATKANNYSDSLRMLNLIDNSDKYIIGVCMGIEGIITRVLCPVYGGYLTFASLEKGKESASGQLSVGELREAWKLMKIS
jgi:3-dehydroquinate dehydratase / shikimate dehydrogenase